MEKLAQYYPNAGKAWTKTGQLPGGDLDGYDRDGYARLLRQRYNWLPEGMALRYARTYGSHSQIILKGAEALTDLGEFFGHGLYEAELRYLVEHEWVRQLDDAIWRRTKLGMWLTDEQKQRVADWLAQNVKSAQPQG